MKKRILSVVLCLCLILTLTSGVALGAEVPSDAEAMYYNTEAGGWRYGSLREAISNVDAGDYVVVLRDIQLEEMLTVTRPMTITSYDSDHPRTITYSPKGRDSDGNEDYLLTVDLPAMNPYYPLNLTHIILDGGWEKGRVSQNPLVYMKFGVLFMKDGAVIQNNVNTRVDGAGGLRFSGGMFYLNEGATIRGCRGMTGGGVKIDGYQLQMAVNGGTIENCEAFHGGGIYVTGQYWKNAKLYVQDGGIVHNRAAETVEGIDCPDNMSPGYGGGVFVYQGNIAFPPPQQGRVFNGVVRGNHADHEGGGFYYFAGTLTMLSGAVTGNHAKQHGGGIAAITPRQSTVVVGGDIRVTGNTSDDGGNNLYLDLRLDAEVEEGTDPIDPVLVAAPLAETSSIGISRHIKPDAEHPYRVVVDRYAPSIDLSNELGKFFSDDPLYATLLHSDPGGEDDGTIVITRADVAFDNCGHGVRPPSEFIDTQGKVPAPEELQADGYEFLGWFTEKENGTQWNFTEDSVTTDEKPQFLYAHWDPIEYDILYDLDGGTNAQDNPLHYNIETPDITLKPPAREGYHFRGWLEVPVEETASLLAVQPEEIEAAEIGAADIPTGSFGVKKFVAQWEEAALCAVTYEDGVGGAVFPPEAHTGLLLWSRTPPFDGGAIPTRTGYTFTGWDPAVSETVTTEEPILYTAQWELDHYGVTYQLDGGVNADGNPTGYTVESGEIPLKVPTKAHYTFVGWTWPGQDVPQTQAAIPAGSIGHKVYTAHWEANSYPVRFDVQGHGAAPAEGSVPYGGKAAAPEDPAESGWVFGGWYKEPTCETSWNFDADTVTGPVTLYAKWTAAPEPPKPSRPKPDPAEEKPPYSPPSLESAEHFAYLVGFPDGTVRPEDNITRAEAATVFFRLMTEEFRRENWSETSPFPDVSPESWYNNAVSTGLRAGLIRGLPDGTFGGERPITRAEFAALAARFLSDDAAPPSGFSDLAGHWAEGEVDRAVAAGWIKGYPDGNFHPHDYITRAQVVTLVNRMLNRTPKAEGMEADMTLWPDNPPTAWYYADVQEATNGHTYRRDSENGEVWTGLAESPDWAQLER